MKRRVIELSGSPLERGIQHGSALAREIKECIMFYCRVFHMTEEELAQNGAMFKGTISAWNTAYATEIEGIATGAEVDPRLIYAINARSEIRSFSDECTAISFPHIPLGAQTWDWGIGQEELFQVVRITYDDGHKILQMIEPGMLGKIGISSSGVAVCLNALIPYKRMEGLPIHILLRSALDARTHKEAKAVLATPHNTAGNILATFSNNTFLNAEHFGEEVFVRGGDNAFIHTNHYLGREITRKELPRHHSSYARYQTMEGFIQNAQQTIILAKKLLADKSNEIHPISRPPQQHLEFGEYGTVCNIILDISENALHITPGRPQEHAYQTFFLHEKPIRKDS